MLSHYSLTKKQVLVVSLAEQAMRVYQNGKLINSYHVTTGRQELPSLPGVWSVLTVDRLSSFRRQNPRVRPTGFPIRPSVMPSSITTEATLYMMPRGMPTSVPARSSPTRMQVAPRPTTSMAVMAVSTCKKATQAGSITTRGGTRQS